MRVGGHVALPHAFSFAKAARAFAPDGILLTTFKKTFLAGLGAHRARVPRVVARIGLEGDRPGRRFVYRLAFDRWIDRVVVNADALRAPVLEDLPDADPAKVVTVYNGVRAGAPGRDPASVRRELGLAEGDPVVGVVARLDRMKRLDRFLDVIARLPEARGVVVGDGPEAAGLTARAEEIGVTDRVVFTGHREDVVDLLQVMDVFLLVSDREGMSNAMLEALSQGVPVVSTPVSGAREALTSEGTPPGRIVDPEVEGLTRAVRSLLQDVGLRERMSRAARERARERFDAERKIPIWARLLTDDVHADVHEGPSPLR